jgi:hypothetical protein
MASKEEFDRSSYGESNRDDKKAHKREKMAHFSSYALQFVGTLLIFMMWASNGEDWSYVEVGDFKLGGRGYCDGRVLEEPGGLNKS